MCRKERVRASRNLQHKRQCLQGKAGGSAGQEGGVLKHRFEKRCRCKQKQEATCVKQAVGAKQVPARLNSIANGNKSRQLLEAGRLCGQDPSDFS